MLPVLLPLLLVLLMPLLLLLLLLPLLLEPLPPRLVMTAAMAACALSLRAALLLRVALGTLRPLPCLLEPFPVHE
jgi:hypothetical protein